MAHIFSQPAALFHSFTHSFKIRQHGP